MADQRVKFSSKPGRATPTIGLFALLSDTVIAAPVTAVPGSNDPSMYTGTFVDAPAGRHRVILYSAGVAKAQDYVTIGATTGDYPVEGLLEKLIKGKEYNMAITGGQEAPVTFGEPA